MDANELTALLPDHPRDGMIKAAADENAGEFGGGFLIYHRESVTEETVSMKDAMDPEDWEAYRNGLRRRWSAVCACTNCGETWLTGWGRGGKITMYEGPDGTLYEGFPEEYAPAYCSDFNKLTVAEGDAVRCPLCGERVTAVRQKNFRSGRTFRLMLGSVENVGDYTAVLFWLASRTVRTVSGTGEESTDAKPCAAIVIDRDGTPLFFSRARYEYAGRMLPADEWKPVRTLDAFQARYYSYEAINRTKVGGWMWRNIPDLTGKTGEKTGLADYVRDGGAWPALYLLFRRRYPAVENVVRSGWTVTIDDCIATEATYKRGRLRFPHELEGLMNWNAVRPRDILRMNRKAAAMGRVWRWDRLSYALWSMTLNFRLSAPEYAEDFQGLLTDYGVENMREFIDSVTDGAEYEMSEFDRYLKRQRRKYGLDLPTGMRTLFDYREMLDETLDGRTPTTEELWPKNLRAAHDRMADASRARVTAGFDRILERWGGLEWTDGEFCARLPRNHGELIDEGRTLHHCVGTYARSHVEGKIIVFIRRYRRPERSWFTLNEDLTGDCPRRIQLHGYGNEYANGKRLTIPKKVLDFCDRWERNALLPLFREVKRREAEKNASKRTRIRTR